MLNKVILIGRLTNKIELRKTSEGISYAFFNIAVNRQVSNGKTDFISCVVWRNLSELMAKYLNKGSLIAIEGKLETYRQNDKDNYETRTTVNVSNVNFLEKKSSAHEIEQQDLQNDSIKFNGENDFLKNDDDLLN